MATDGTIELKDQLSDYKFRGEEFAHMSFVEFMLNTYEGLAGSTNQNEEGEDNGPIQYTADTDHDETPQTQMRGPGRPLSM